MPGDFSRCATLTDGVRQCTTMPEILVTFLHTLPEIVLTGCRPAIIAVITPATLYNILVAGRVGGRGGIDVFDKTDSNDRTRNAIFNLF